jgi:hypothetical protein
LAWLHGYTFPAYGGKNVTYRWEPKDHGLDNVMDIEGIDDTHISCYGFPTVNQFALPAVEPGGELVRSMIYRVPANDALTLLYFVRFYPSEKRERQTSVIDSKHGEYAPLETDWWGIDINDQDRMAVEQQGVIADRPNEHLGVTDGGIILMRQMMRDSLNTIFAGKNPLCIIRDAAAQVVDFRQQSTMMSERQDDANYAIAFTTPGGQRVA